MKRIPTQSILLPSLHYSLISFQFTPFPLPPSPLSAITDHWAPTNCVTLLNIPPQLSTPASSPVEIDRMSLESIPSPPRSPSPNPVTDLLDKYLRALPKTPPQTPPASPNSKSLQRRHAHQAARVVAKAHLANAYLAETDAQLREALRDADAFQQLYNDASNRADHLEDECRQLRDAVHRLHRAHMADANFNAAVIRDQAAEIQCLKENLQDNQHQQPNPVCPSVEHWHERGQWHKEWTRLSSTSLRGLSQTQCLSVTTDKTEDNTASQTSTSSLTPNSRTH